MQPTLVMEQNKIIKKMKENNILTYNLITHFNLIFVFKANVKMFILNFQFL